MNAGKLRDRVTIESPQRTTSAATNHRKVSGWETVDTVWADVQDDGGARFPEAMRVAARITTTVRMRYRTDVTPSCRILFRGRVLKIVSPPMNPDGVRRELLLGCTEVVE